MEWYMYPLILCGVAAVAYIGVWAFRKWNIKQDEIEFLKLIFDVVEFINQKFEYKNKEKVTEVVKYTFEAIELVQKISTTETIAEQKELIKTTAIDICKRNNIEVDQETVIIIDKIIDYILEKYVIQNIKVIK